MRREPLGWSLGITVGAALAAFMGGYVPSWGVALAPAAATLVFSVGAFRLPEDDTLAWVLRVTLALTVGFVAVTAPVTLSRLGESPEAALEAEELLSVRGIDEVEAKLRAMWIVMGSMVPIGAIALGRRWRLLGKAEQEPGKRSD
jgi:hypothetical protein